MNLIEKHENMKNFYIKSTNKYMTDL